MALLYYLRLLQRHWLAVLLALIIALGASAAVTAQTPPTYAASISLLVSAQDPETTAATAYQALLLSQQRVKSYANLMTSRRVIGQIVHGEEAIRSLQGRISAESVPETVLLRATVTDSDRRRSADLANALGAAFTRVIDQIERPRPQSPPMVRVTVIDSAAVPDRPIRPRPLVNDALAALLALLATGGALALRDRIDTTIKTAEDLRAVSGAPVLGIIGYERDARRHPLVLRDGKWSARAEALRSLRTNLQFIGVDRQPKSLLVTSCLPGEGKSATSVNLAITLARAGWRVLLVDGDLRNPRVPDYLGIEGAAGLTDALIDRERLPDLVQTWGECHLSVLPGGRIPPNPSELLASQGMRQLLTQLAGDYDMVIIDAPPLLPVTDAATLAAICDGVLLIARYGKTRREHLTRAVASLASVRADVVGAVLNRVPLKATDHTGYASKEPEVALAAG